MGRVFEQTERGGTLSFQYDPGWIELKDAFPLSVSMPLTEAAYRQRFIKTFLSKCWPHNAIREAVKRVYGFCSDYPGIRHNVRSVGRIRALETRDSIIVPLLLLAAAGYFAPNGNMLDTLRNAAFDPKQEPPDPPMMEEPLLERAGE